MDKTNLKTELKKTKIWFEPGLIVTVNEIGDVSGILYKPKGWFKKWRLVDTSFTREEFSIIKEKFEKSYLHTPKIMGGDKGQVSLGIARQEAIMLLKKIQLLKSIERLK